MKFSHFILFLLSPLTSHILHCADGRQPALTVEELQRTLTSQRETLLELQEDDNRQTNKETCELRIVGVAAYGVSIIFAGSAIGLSRFNVVAGMLTALTGMGLGLLVGEGGMRHNSTIQAQSRTRFKKILQKESEIKKTEHDIQEAQRDHRPAIVAGFTTGIAVRIDE
jgi:hypothetical protein